MPRPEKETLQSILKELKDSLRDQAAGSQSFNSDIPSIIEFVESEEYLGLPTLDPPIKLFPMQRLVLRCFYRGTPGNIGPESDFSEDELLLLKKAGLDSDDRGNVLAKIQTPHIFRELVLVCGRGCLSEDTEFTSPATGTVSTLGAMWDAGNVDGLMSWTLDERTAQMVVMPSCNLLNQGINQVFKIDTATGHNIEATANHPFLTQRGWVSVADLRVGEDKIAVVTSEPFFGTSDAISEHEAAILGYITGDGCCSQHSVFFTCGNDAVRQDFERCLHLFDPNLELFADPWTGAKSKQYQYKIRQRVTQYEKYYSKQHQRTITKLKQTSLCKLLAKHGLMGKTCHHKVVQPALYACPKRVIAYYVRSLFSGDVSFSKNRSRRHQITIEFSSVNRQQVVSVAALLRRFGILSRIRTRSQHTTIKAEHKSYDSISYSLSFTKRRYVRRFIDAFGFCFKSNADAVRDTIAGWTSEGTGSQSFEFTTIKTIESIGRKRTFDIQVSSNTSLQNFTAQGVIAHNSGKDFLASIIALYEAMKLLKTPSGNPYGTYNLPRGGNPITILTIATSAKQAKIAFQEIKSKLLRSKFFANKYIPEGLQNESLFLLTPQDEKDNIERKQKGLPLEKGGIEIRAGHSNSDGLLGIQCFVLLLDEVASFGTTEGSSGGRRIYEGMLPSLNRFVRPKLDERGEVVCDSQGEPQRVFDSKVISLSSPRGKDGILYEMFRDAPKQDDRLAFRLPTWVVNTKYTRDLLRKTFTQFNDDRFMMEYGAEFSASAGTNFFDEDAVKACFDPTMQFKERGVAGVVYFAHLDPATNSNNYALAVCHKEMRVNPVTRKADAYVIVDHLRCWVPSRESPINLDEVDSYILMLNKLFHIGLVTYDAFNSAASIQKLRRVGIPTKMTPYNGKYKNVIYSQLEMLINSRQIIIPRPGGADDAILENELINLQRQYNSGARGFRVFANKECETPTDDAADAVAGAAYNALSTSLERLPQSRLVSMPSSQRGATMSMLGMQGTPYAPRVLDHMRAKNGESGFGFAPPPRPGY